MIEQILKYVQPITVIGFLVSGICCIILKQWKFAVINLSLTATNLFIFYGHVIFK